MIVNVAAVTVLSAIAVECIVRLPFLFFVKAVTHTSHKALRVVGSDLISDHWKEKVLLAYAGESLAASLKLMVLLVLVGTFLVALSVGIDRISGDFLAFIASPAGIIGTLVAAGIYVKARTVVATGKARL